MKDLKILKLKNQFLDQKNELNIIDFIYNSKCNFWSILDKKIALKWVKLAKMFYFF